MVKPSHDDLQWEVSKRKRCVHTSVEYFELTTKNLVLLSIQLDEYLILIFGLFTCLGCVSRTIEMIFDR